MVSEHSKSERKIHLQGRHKRTQQGPYKGAPGLPYPSRLASIAPVPVIPNLWTSPGPTIHTLWTVRRGCPQEYPQPVEKSSGAITRLSRREARSVKANPKD